MPRTTSAGELDPYKQAEYFKWFVDHGWKHDEIAKRHRIDRTTVTKHLSLNKIDPVVKEKLANVPRVTVEHRDDGSMVVLVEERVFDKHDWVVLQKFPLSITKGTYGVGDATYGTYRFGKALEPKVAWKVIEAIEEHRGHGDNKPNPERSFSLGGSPSKYPCSYLKFKSGERERQRRYAPGRHLVPEYMHVRVVNSNAPYHTPKEGGEFRVDVFTWFRGISGRRVAVEFFDNIGQVKKFVMGLKEKHGTKRSRFTIITKDDFNILDGG